MAHLQPSYIKLSCHKALPWHLCSHFLPQFIFRMCEHYTHSYFNFNMYTEYIPSMYVECICWDVTILITWFNWPVLPAGPYVKVIIKLKMLDTLRSVQIRQGQTAQPIRGLGSKAILACCALANQRLGKQCYPSMQCSQHSSYKRPYKSSQKEEEEDRDFSGSLA